MSQRGTIRSGSVDLTQARKVPRILESVLSANAYSEISNPAFATTIVCGQCSELTLIVHGQKRERCDFAEGPVWCTACGHKRDCH